MLPDLVVVLVGNGEKLCRALSDRFNVLGAEFEVGHMVKGIGL